MKKLDASLIVMILCAVLIIAMSMGLGYLIRDKAILGDESYDTVREAAETIGKNFYYYDDEKQAGLIDDALRGMVSGLDDPYAAYLTAEEYDAMLAEDEGDYSGIGISVLTPDETGKPFQAQIVRLGARIDETSQTLTLIGRPLQADTSLLAGMSGTASFTEAK